MGVNSKVRLMNEPAYTLKDLDKAAEIALFYGFKPVKTPKIEKTDQEQASSIAPDKAEALKGIFPRPEEKISLLRTFLSWNLQNESQPVMLQYKRPISQLSIKRQLDEHHYSLDIIGSLDTISEAIAIRTAMAILTDHGYGKLIVDINSLGDKYSIGQFERELVNFSRKHGADMPPEVKQQLRKDPFEVWRCDHEKWLEIRKRAPQSLSFLSEHGVDNFRQVVEYLETLEIPYRINPGLVGHRHYCSHTIFEIKNDTTGEANGQEETFAVGTRHNYLARRVGFKRDTPVVSVNIRFRKPAVTPKLFFKFKPVPKFFFIQFGSIAKLKSLPVIESLRQARIPVHHMLTSEKFLNQLAAAESLKVPFVIIMGQKEALENTAVVRHMATRSQEIVPIPNLALYLGKLN